ncbi:MAG: phosphatase PAP2 family protein [Kiritimatiellae bacterium]|nr:phosphatase PAP2 family protein [Kiritimatiellia bacterium]
MLRDGLNYWKYATLMATPGGNDPAYWIMDKAKGLLVEVAAQKVNIKSKQWITANAARMRPDLSSHTSFPSGHANNAFGSATLANLNLNSIPMNTTVRHTLQAATWTAAMGTGWARIEANKHYPSDILAAAALANLLTTFIHDAFLGLPEDGIQVGVVPTDEGFELQAVWKF